LDSHSIITRAGIDDLPHLLDMIREFCAIDGHEFEEQRLVDCLPPLLAGDEHGVSTRRPASLRTIPSG
jgi:hypothetical protein